MSETHSIEESVRDRYAEAAREVSREETGYDVEKNRGVRTCPKRCPEENSRLP